MKKTTKNRLTVTCALAAMICGVAGAMAINNFIGAEEDFYGNYALEAFTAYAEAAPEEGETTSVIGATKYNVSQEKDYLLVATTLTDASTVYEVGYDFGGSYTVTENDQAETKKYYTSIKAGDNTYTAANIFGKPYTAETPMIVWEVAYNAAKGYTFQAYAKTGTLDENGNLQITDPETVVHGRNIIIPTVVTPNVNQGVLSWNGTASEYKIYAGKELIGTVSGNTFDLAAALKRAPGSYTIKVEAVGATEPVVYQDVAFEIVGLTNENFVSTLNSASADKYYVLTENVTVNTDYQAEKRTTANGSFGEALVYAPVAEFRGILDGRGYQISVTYGGGAKIDGGWEVFGGLFGYTENSIIQNVNFNFAAQLNGHVHKSFGSGVLAAVLGRNTVVQNCYIGSVINVWNATDVNGIGAIAGKLFGGASGCVIKNNVVSAQIVFNSVQQNSPDRLVADLMENTQMNGNAYIINRALPTAIDADHKLHEEAFMAWGVNAVDNWLFASMADFVSGGVGHKCTYFGATDWHFEWTLSQTPEKNLINTKAWEGTTFAYDTVNGLTLCGKSIQATV